MTHVTYLPPALLLPVTLPHTAPTNQLMAAECDEDCLWNNGYMLNGTAMDAGEQAN